MNSHLKEAVRNIANSKELDWSSFRDSRIRDIERKLDSGKISEDEALQMIAQEFGREFGRHDFETIKKALR